MKKVIIAIALSFSLSGCASSFPNLAAGVAAVQAASVSQDQLDAARAAYVGAFLTPAVAYRRLPRCPQVRVCSDPAKIAKLQQVDKAVQENFNAVQALINSGNNSGLSLAWTALNASIDTAKALVQ